MMDDKIKAGLLGDKDAAEACTAAGIAIPCPFCGGIPGWHIAGESDDLLSFGCQGSNNCVRWIIPFTPPHHANALQAALSRWNCRVCIRAEDNPPLTKERFEAICDAVHNGWWEEKIRQGVTDHPDMRPYTELSEEVKEYDRVTTRPAQEEEQ